MKTQEDAVIMTAGVEHQDRTWFLGNFHGVPPNLRDRKKAGWSLYQEPPQQDAASDLQLGVPWVLENGQGVKTHTGTLEGGLSGPNANYFLLFKEGSTFRCVPLPLWYNFRPAINHKVMDLDEAEAYMLRKERRTYALPTRLGAAMAKAEENGGQDAEDEGGEEDDEEEGENEEEEARAARARGAAPSSSRPAGEDAARPDKVGGPAGEKGEDWEHTQEAADDDLNMEGSEDEAAEPDQPDQDPDARSGGQAASPSSDSGRGEEEDEDDDDLDALAQKLPPQAGAGKGRSAAATPSSRKAGPAEGAVPGAHAGPAVKDGKAASGKRAGAGGLPDAAAKRAKTEKEAPGAGPAARTTVPTAAAGSAAGPPAATSQQGFEREIRDWIQQVGPMSMQDLMGRYKRRLKNDEEAKKLFMAAVKRAVKLEERPPGSGIKMIVLR